MSIYTRGETYVHRILITDRDGTPAYPSDCTLYIYDSCGSLINTGGTSMATDSSNYFEGKYAIPNNMKYGEYDIQVIATDPSGDVAIFDDILYIFPWNIVHDVRKFSGITSEKSISDHDISALIWEAYNEALDEAYEFIHDETPNCNPDTGAWFDGTNTVFETWHGPIADKDGDGVIAGYGEQSCGTDIEGWWKDEDGDCHRLKITANDAHCGKITITQLDGTAIPSSMKWVRINYYIEWRTYNERLFRFAVAYLAAYKCIESFKALDKATLADLDSNRQDIYINKNRMEKEYKKTIKKIKKPVIGCGMLPGK